MINKHKFIEINVSDEEYDTFIQLAACLDLTPSNVISQFVSDLVTGGGGGVLWDQNCFLFLKFTGEIGETGSPRREI